MTEHGSSKEEFEKFMWSEESAVDVKGGEVVGTDHSRI